MQPHEWANHLTRTANQDIRIAEAIAEKLRAIEGICDGLRVTPQLSADGNRLIDDTSVKLDATSRELERIMLDLSSYYQDFLQGITM